MRFKEEVFARIFTYITVTVLLGIIIFEAWSLRGEREALARSEENAVLIQQKLDSMTGRNQKLQEQNRELEIFQNTWLPYAAFVDSSEVLTLKTDLFTRPDRIPREALEEVKTELMREFAEQEADAEAQKEEDGNERDDSAREEEEKAEEYEPVLAFQFDNPDGEDIFFPVSIDAAALQNCLVYTVAFDMENDLSMELIYEVNFENGHQAVRDENGEVEWNCIAYNLGDGWKGIMTEGEEEDAID